MSNILALAETQMGLFLAFFAWNAAYLIIYLFMRTICRRYLPKVLVPVAVLPTQFLGDVSTFVIVQGTNPLILFFIHI